MHSRPRMSALEYERTILYNTYQGYWCAILYDVATNCNYLDRIIVMSFHDRMFHGDMQHPLRCLVENNRLLESVEKYLVSLGAKFDRVNVNDKIIC